MTDSQKRWHKRVKSTRLTPTTKDIREHFKSVTKCYICGTETNQTAPRGNEFKREFDHIIPLSKGGKHRLTNIAVCCGYCNRRKGNKTLDEMTDYGYDTDYDFMDWGE
jgi:5-methylcytosine-specific restriction endonuclease McrA